MLHVCNQSDIDNKANLTQDIYVEEDNDTMDELQSKQSHPKTSTSTTLPVRYIVEDVQSCGENSAEVESNQLNEIYTTDDDENKIYILKSCNSDLSTSQQSAESASEAEIAVITSSSNNQESIVKIEPELFINGDSAFLNGNAIPPRHPASTNVFRLSIPSIEEVKESSSDCGEMDNPPQLYEPKLQKNNFKSLQVNKHTERRSSFAGVSQNKRPQHRPFRRRFSISVSSSDDETSSSDSESEEQRKIERYLQSRQRRRHSSATTSNELLQAMSVLMGRRSSGKESNLFPLLANALTNLANVELQNQLAKNDKLKNQRKSTPNAPLIKINHDGECTCHCKQSAENLLTRPYSPNGFEKQKSTYDSLSEKQIKQRLEAEVEVLRILTTRSPVVSEDDDSDREFVERPLRRRRSKNGRKSFSSLNVPEIKHSQARRSSTGTVSLLSQRTSRTYQTKSSESASCRSSRSQSRRSSLSDTPPNSNPMSAHEGTESNLIKELRKRLENSENIEPSANGTALQPPVVETNLSKNFLEPQCDKHRTNRRASMSVPVAYNITEHPPVSKDEEEEIRRRATLRGRRRSSWAAGASPALVTHIRAKSPMTLLRESNYYGDDLADNKKYQDPYFLTIHFITDPKKSKKLKKLLKPLIESIVPKLKLFNYVERSEKMPKKPEMSKEEKLTTVPASGVVLFINEGFGMERITEAQKYLSEKSEWSVHHSEKVGANAVPYPTNNQDFYAHHEDMPLWAVRQVHFGRDRLRFQIFVSNGNWQNTIDFYSTVLARNFQYRKDDFCYFLVYANKDLNIEVQLAFKKLPEGFKPRLLDSTILQFKVETIESLYPLLPNVCTSISDRRWQTVDPDGNKILLFKTDEMYPLGAFSTPSTASTMSQSTLSSTEISDTETGTPDPSPRVGSPKLPVFIDHIKTSVVKTDVSSMVSAV